MLGRSVDSAFLFNWPTVYIYIYIILKTSCTGRTHVTEAFSCTKSSSTHSLVVKAVGNVCFCPPLHIWILALL